MATGGVASLTSAATPTASGTVRRAKTDTSTCGPLAATQPALVDALDCDLGLSPVTNMMPILRHSLLHRGGPIEFTMAWVEVPALTVHADGQRYGHLSSGPGRHVVRYEATDGSFAADITIDADAVVIDYPGIARRLPARPQSPR